MNSLEQAKRSLEFNILRTCERFSLSETDFDSFAYESQLKLLAFNQLRMLEETIPPAATSS